MWYVIFSWIIILLSVTLFFFAKNWTERVNIIIVGASFAIGILFVK